MSDSHVYYIKRRYTHNTIRGCIRGCFAIGVCIEFGSIFLQFRFLTVLCIIGGKPVTPFYISPCFCTFFSPCFSICLSDCLSICMRLHLFHLCPPGFDCVCASCASHCVGLCFVFVCFSSLCPFLFVYWYLYLSQCVIVAMCLSSSASTPIK